MTDFANFMSVNGLKRKDIATFLGVSGAFITQIANGDRPIPEEKLAMIRNNAYGWDISMLTPKSQKGYLSFMQGFREVPEERMQSKTESAISHAVDSIESSCVHYLKAQIDDKDRLIRELEKKIGMLEAKLDLARKGEIVRDVDGSSDAFAV